MRKSHNDINRNVFNHIRNNKARNHVVTPDIHFNQLWFENNNSSGVKIIELSSSGSSKDSLIKNGGDHNSQWYPNNNAYFDEDIHYRVNEEARNRRRMRLDQNFKSAFTNDDYHKNNPFYKTYDSKSNDDATNHHVNCFTIIKNQNINSDSSSEIENYEGIEIIEVDGNTNVDEYWNHVYNEDAVTYNVNSPSEKCTIWMYSYKNKRLLSDNDFELVNIPSQDSSTSATNSISDDDVKADKGTTMRIGSPIPATYIPRLDLSLVQTLSTVTEISEHNKPSNESSHEKLHIKPRNNWFTERNDRMKSSENSDILNWMALSPRERRRRSINTSSEATATNEVDVTFAEGVQPFEQADEESSITDLLTVKVKVDVHDSQNEMADPQTPNVMEPKETNTAAKPLPVNISFPETSSDLESNMYFDFDDNKKPRIKIFSNKTNKSIITGPMEKLDSNNWISEEGIEEEVTSHNYNENFHTNINELGKIETELSKRLWMKNLQLMKPAQWAEYLPLSCSPQTLHLSLSLSSINKKKSWLNKLKRCITCCK